MKRREEKEYVGRQARTADPYIKKLQPYPFGHKTNDVISDEIWDPIVNVMYGHDLPLRGISWELSQRE